MRTMEFGYKDTDEKIGIKLYGLEFEIKNLENLDTEKVKEDSANENKMDELLERILGQGAIDRINEKRIADGHEEMTLDIKLSILGCIFQAYASASTDKLVDRVESTAERINRQADRFRNREFRRNNQSRRSRNYRRY